MFKHILVATDGSKLSEAAGRRAVQLAKSLSATLTGITVSTPFHVLTTDAVSLTDSKDEYESECDKRAAKALGVIKTNAESAGVGFEGVHVFDDHPHEAIIATATKHGCDAICMASHGRRGISALLIGSETLKVLTHSAIPVVVWR